jgi:hypothetical protein
MLSYTIHQFSYSQHVEHIDAYRQDLRCCEPCVTPHIRHHICHHSDIALHFFALSFRHSLAVGLETQTVFLTSAAMAGAEFTNTAAANAATAARATFC